MDAHAEPRGARRCCARQVVLNGLWLALLTACGGAQEPVSNSDAPPGSVAQMAGALDQYKRDQPFKAVRAGLPNSVVNAGQAPAPRSCAQRLHAALANAAAEVPTPFDCFVGVHRGADLRGGACVLHIGATPQGYRFRQPAGDFLVIEAEAPAAALGLTIGHRLTQADVESNAIGLLLRREDRSPGGARETLTLTISAQADGRDQLRSMSFERVVAGEVRISRCQFAS